MNVKIFPKNLEYARQLHYFLGQHGFLVGPLVKEGFFRAQIAPAGSPNRIDTVDALLRLSTEPKVSPTLEFYYEEDKDEPAAEHSSTP